ncbi:3'-5' exonuclease [Rosistilla oblonga]|uniref:3'-5' exonuclease n=1 Tax=Rosistilla oblonga TaxID=2527990 RepID=UPI003A97DE51
MSAATDVRYLVFDVESVADGDLIARARYKSDTMQAGDAIEEFRSDLVNEGGKDFIPYTFQMPVAVVIAKVSADLELLDLVSLDEPLHRPHVITQHFWRGWQAYKQPTWVTFNGRGFDIPLMELAAFRHGIQLPEWFNMSARTYDQNRNRYNMKSHIDLHEVLTNFGSTWFRGGLNLAANLVGKPGKMVVAGNMVQGLYEQGELQTISDYCRCDVLDTYFVFLRFNVISGRIDVTREQELVAKAKQFIVERAADCQAYADYLEGWGEWENPWTAGT